MKINRTTVLVGPALHAVSGVATHINMLLASRLAAQYRLLHFQIGSEGRSEGAFQKLSRLVTSPFAFGAFLVRYRPAIIHINTSLVPRAYWRDFVYLSVAKAFGRQVVSQIHGGALPEQFATNGVTRFLLRRFLRASAIVTVLSSEELRAYEAFDKDAHFELVPNAISLTGCLIGSRVSAKEDSLRLVYVGRIVRSKGVFDVLTALALLRQEGLVCKFQVAGSGEDESQVRDAIVRLGLDAEVTLLGPVFGAAKNKLWLDSDALVFPTYFEGLPYSLLESMAAGCVPIISPVGGIPDVMQDGIHGIFVPVHSPVAVANAIRRLANDRLELQRMSLAGRERIREQYTVDRLADRFGEIYKRLSS